MTQSLALPQPGEIVGRKYRIVAQVGAGGMGVVLEAVHVDTEAQVALKWLNPELSSNAEAIERFKIEARATGRIRHPNVVAIHDIGDHEGHLYIAMEFLIGAPLRVRISQALFTGPEACRVLFPVMRGVSAAHAVKILHRDLKPDNIFLVDSPDGLDPVPKVLDFGIAKLCSDAEATGSVSARTALMGTYQYMAPEQLHAQRDLDERVDVYALGVVLYNMLSGRLPYVADNPVDLALQMLQGAPSLVCDHTPRVPRAMAEVIARALARDREQRFATVDAFAAALEPFAEGLRYKGSTGKTPPLTAPDSASELSTPQPLHASRPQVLGAPPASVPPIGTPFHRASLTPRAVARTSSAPRSKAWLALGAVAASGAALAFWVWGSAPGASAPPALPSAQATPTDPSSATGSAASSKNAALAAPPSVTLDAQVNSDDWSVDTPQALAPSAHEDGAVPENAVPHEHTPTERPLPSQHAAPSSRPTAGAPRVLSDTRPAAGKHGRAKSRSEAAQPAAQTAPDAVNARGTAPTQAPSGYGASDLTELPTPSWARPRD